MHKQYLIYKDSGIKWIGLIPNDWDIAPIRVLCYLGRGRVISNEEIANNSGDYPVYSSQTAENGIMGCLNTYDFDGEYVTWTTDGANAGTVFHRQGKFNCTNVCGTLKTKAGKSFPRYLPYVLNLGTRCYVRYDINPKLMNNEMAGIRIPLPTIEEQKDISRYLDRKTAQINDLIAKKERMIELLKEERTAIINQAVTKGLNPEAEMKDSGIDWLGRVPKHWEIKKLKFNAAVQFSNVDKKSDESEKPVRLCNYVDVYYNDCITPDLNFMEATASSEEINKFHLKTGDVLLTKDSEEWNDIAIPAYMTFEAPDLICGYHLAQVRPQEKVLLGKYLFWLLSADSINHQFQIEASGVTRYGLSNYALCNSTCLLPPKKEQEAIATFLDKKTAQIDVQIAREEKSIELLKEYRTSLISEVVTGKIDVRGRA